MIKHIIMWDFHPDIAEAQKKEVAQKVKQELEGLRKTVYEISELKVITEVLPSSNGDLMLVSSFQDANALQAYQMHPEHVRVSAFVKTVTTNRRCIDYLEA